MNIASLGFSVLNKVDITYLEELLFDAEGCLRVLPYNDLKDIPQEHLSVFCVYNGIYTLPTQELVDFLSEEIGEAQDRTVEIGAGNGVLGRALGIKSTDNLMQLTPDIKAYYESLGQAIVSYGDNVEKLDAMQAVKKYSPEIVIAAWVTHKYNAREHWRGGNAMGVDENTLLKKVKKYIMVGNVSVHGKKPILSLPHRTILAPWILSRSVSSDQNLIYIWERENV